MSIFLNGVGAGTFKVTVAGVDLTNHVKTVTINQTVDDVDVTAFGAVSKAHMPGLRDDSMEFEFFQDFAASSVDQTLNTLLGSSTGATVVVIAGGTTPSSTTPSYTMVGSPYTYNPIDGSVGDASMNKVTFKPAPGSSVVRGTT